MGKKFANGRNSISFHSLRWFVRTSVKEATNDEALAYYWVGKENVKYEFDGTGEKLKEKYKLIEPALTFLDLKIINKIGEGHQVEIDHLKKQMELQNQQITEQKKEIILMKFDDVIEEMIETHPPQRVITPTEQLEYFIKNSSRVTNEDIELLKEMINERIIRAYEEEPKKMIEFDEEAIDRYNYINKVISTTLAILSIPCKYCIPTGNILLNP